VEEGGNKKTNGFGKRGRGGGGDGRIGPERMHSRERYGSETKGRKGNKKKSIGLFMRRSCDRIRTRTHGKTSHRDAVFLERLPMAATVMTLWTQPHDHGRGVVGVHRNVEESRGTGNRWPTGVAIMRHVSDETSGRQGCSLTRRSARWARAAVTVFSIRGAIRARRPESRIGHKDTPSGRRRGVVANEEWD